MATFSPDRGVNEREPTLIADGELQDTDGAEYRVGEPGIFVARGRRQLGDIGSVTNRGAYEAGFDGSSGFVIAHEGNNLHSISIHPNVGISLVAELPTGSSAIVGTHYANRHYLATGVANKRLERAIGVTSFPVGMSATTFAVGTSQTTGSGAISATIGLEYWVTEYDSTRGIESIHGSTVNTGVFTDIDGVVLTVTGVSANPRADTIRWYRSVDGGGYPDGGIIRSTPIGTTQITDVNTATASFTVPLYGVISLGGLDTDRDEAPPVLDTIFGPYQDSLLGVAVNEPRVLRFTPAGFPDSWPSGYSVPIQTSRTDGIVTGVVLPGRIGVFSNNSVHVIFRLPRDADAVFAAGEAQDIITDERGCPSRRGATVFTPPGSGPLAVWVSRDGIWASNLTTSPVPLTDNIDWDGRVDIAQLHSCRLLDDALNRRLVFIHKRQADGGAFNTGVWYLDYQKFNELGIRVTFANHGPLVDGVSILAPDSRRRVFSMDSRVSNGQFYVESIQDVDDSQLRDSDGSVRFRMKTKEFLPAGVRGTRTLGKATWMHDAGPAEIKHRFYFNRRDDNPEEKVLSDPTIRTASDVVLQRNVNSASLEIESSGTKSYGVHWIDIEGFDLGNLGGRQGA
jgi:hypothetical protein